MAVEPTRSQKRTVSCRRSPSAAVPLSAAPHAPQNFSSGLLRVPHEGHAWPRRLALGSYVYTPVDQTSDEAEGVQLMAVQTDPLRARSGPYWIDRGVL